MDIKEKLLFELENLWLEEMDTYYFGKDSSCYYDYAYNQGKLSAYITYISYLLGTRENVTYRTLIKKYENQLDYYKKRYSNKFKPL